MDKLFMLTYFPYRPDVQPHTALEEAIQYLYDCWEYEDEYQPQAPAAENGNQDAIHWLFFAYHHNDWHSSDDEECERRKREATKWLKKAAEQGNTDAIEALMFDGRDREAILEVDEDGFMPCPKFDSEEACPF